MNYHFLQEIKKIQDFHERHKELSGENFNIFSIMSMESDEVFTHSALISELLDPKGTHGLGTKPLEIFCRDILEVNDLFYDFQKVSCLREEHIGLISEDQTEGGRLDIVVKDKEENGFVIENKIYAGEQINQLSRYSKRYRKAKILYLTLFGKESSQLIINGDSTKIYNTISYEKHILNWVTECAKLAFDKLMLREVLNQYLYLIKKLTNQSTNKSMSDEILKLIDDNFDASLAIYNNFTKVLEQKQTTLLYDIKNKIEKKSNIETKIIKEIEFKNTNGFNQLKFYLERDFYLIFRLKTNYQGLLLIGNSSQQFHLNDQTTTIQFKNFKRPDWKLNEGNEYLLWKHLEHFSAIPEYFLDRDQDCKNEQIAEKLLVICCDFHNTLIR